MLGLFELLQVPQMSMVPAISCPPQPLLYQLSVRLLKGHLPPSDSLILGLVDGGGLRRPELHYSCLLDFQLDVFALLNLEQIQVHSSLLLGRQQSLDAHSV